MVLGGGVSKLYGIYLFKRNKLCDLCNVNRRIFTYISFCPWLTSGDGCAATAGRGDN